MIKLLTRPAVPQSKSQQPGTIIFATPAKPRYGNPFSSRGIHHPTPIREESRSAERRPGFIAETPSTSRVPGTPSTTTTSRIAETPRTERILGYTPASVLTYTDHGDEDGDGDEDDLGDLMVMTDDEDEGEEERHTGPPPIHGFIPETPAK